jgi:CheY-like chemotaxis protein
MLRSDLLDFMRAHGMPVLSNNPPNRLRIAVVDDERALVRALLRMLARAAPGADCRSAHDGFSAGALLTSFHPDLIFLDVVMPGLSGVEVCEHIRSKPELRGAAVVIVSGHLTPGLRSRLEIVGVDGFIEKPFGLSDVESALADLVADAREQTLGPFTQARHHEHDDGGDAGTFRGSRC